MNNRIRVAEAMGWKRIELSGYKGRDVWQKGDIALPHKDARVIYATPDPENDANDDYSVLEWMRDRGDAAEWWDFCNELDLYAQDYQIGDYYRAALKAIEFEAASLKKTAAARYEEGRQRLLKMTGTNRS